jgi:hypothetical protein
MTVFFTRNEPGAVTGEQLHRYGGRLPPGGFLADELARTGDRDVIELMLDKPGPPRLSVCGLKMAKLLVEEHHDLSHRRPQPARAQ